MEQKGRIRAGEIIVYFQDECHQLWGDCLGYLWGRRGQRLQISMVNERERQTFYGAVNLVTEELHLKEAPRGDGEQTAAFIKWLREKHPDQQLWVIWDGAKHHRYGEMLKYLSEQNEGLSELDWKITCLWFAPNAPEQNPIEDIWLKGKNALRRAFNENQTFTKVKECFKDNLKEVKLSVEKLEWYWTNPQTI